MQQAALQDAFIFTELEYFDHKQLALRCIPYRHDKSFFYCHITALCHNHDKTNEILCYEWTLGNHGIFHCISCTSHVLLMYSMVAMDNWSFPNRHFHTSVSRYNSELETKCNPIWTMQQAALQDAFIFTELEYFDHKQLALRCIPYRHDKSFFYCHITVGDHSWQPRSPLQGLWGTYVWFSHRSFLRHWDSRLSHHLAIKTSQFNEYHLHK
jgi:hypothetical protein